MGGDVSKNGHTPLFIIEITLKYSNILYGCQVLCFFFSQGRRLLLAVLESCAGAQPPGRACSSEIPLQAATKAVAGRIARVALKQRTRKQSVRGTLRIAYHSTGPRSRFASWRDVRNARCPEATARRPLPGGQGRIHVPRRGGVTRTWVPSQSRQRMKAMAMAIEPRFSCRVLPLACTLSYCR